MKREKTCCFTGHRYIPINEYEKIQSALEHTIISLIKKGVCYFGAGGALGFDTMVALTILKLKVTYPHIKLILVLPCENQTYKWQQKDIFIYENIKSKCDKYVYTSKYYYDGCMLKRNKHLVDNSKYCVCYKSKDTGGTAFTVNYAIKNGLTVINIADILYTK